MRPNANANTHLPSRRGTAVPSTLPGHIGQSQGGAQIIGLFSIPNLGNFGARMLAAQPFLPFPSTETGTQFTVEDDELLIDTLAQSKAQYNELEALQSLSGCNGHSFEDWRDYWLAHSRRLENMLTERTKSIPTQWIKSVKAARERSPSIECIERPNDDQRARTKRGDPFTADDTNYLVNALAQRQGGTHKDVLRGLDGHNGHVHSEWVDHYLTHANTINTLVSDATTRLAGRRDDRQIKASSSKAPVSQRPKPSLPSHGHATSLDYSSDEDDVPQKNSRGQQYTDVEKEALARHVARIPVGVKDMRWHRLDKKCSTRTACAWGKYYRAHRNEVEDHITYLGLTRPER
ncbi:hypothetical protein PLICRDRAFT_173596 [Plicaturopsis crispa FD-325 SS-3]|nr:hypothetical protein PLICRDRAFT_173596 [Plicaturopsis crispa FD-325 SS-3]